ncbi:hypothetical protein FQR65_LT13643 [Abscondita terminalis]|nr:hypothetical protein FQR65_LT13643 [Abscondita terminalis]
MKCVNVRSKEIDDIVSRQEAPLKVTVDKLELVRCNKDYVENAKAVVFHYNDTHQAVNASWKLIKDLGMDLKDNVDIYGVESDGPHLMSTAKDINICDILGGGFPELEELFKFGNFTKCPMKAGYYGATNAILDTSKVPPNAPKGTFMLDIKTSEGDVEIANCKLTITIA